MPESSCLEHDLQPVDTLSPPQSSESACRVLSVAEKARLTDGLWQLPSHGVGDWALVGFALRRESPWERLSIGRGLRHFRPQSREGVLLFWSFSAWTYCALM